MPFSDLAPSKRKKLSTKLRVGYVFIEESFDTIFDMGYGFPSMDYGQREYIYIYILSDLDPSHLNNIRL